MSDADAEGFSDVLVVKTSRAGGPGRQLAQLKFAMSTRPECRLKEDYGGGFAGDGLGGGGLVFEAPQPMTSGLDDGHPADTEGHRARAAARGPRWMCEGSSDRPRSMSRLLGCGDPDAGQPI